MLESLYDRALGWLFEAVVQPPMYAWGLMDWADDALVWLNVMVCGVLAILVIYAVCRPLESWRPVERWDSRRAIKPDIIYTLLARLGLLPMLAFVLFAAAQAAIEGWIADTGWVSPTLETLFPVLERHPLLAFAAYVVVLDFAEYWRHRLQHSVGWWWALHSVHHAQRQMTFWTDDRNHVLDDVLAAAWFGLVAVAIGVPPGQFPLILLVLQLVESLSHANVRLEFGWLGERVLVSPRFHRLHHGVLSVARQGRNYGELLPVWDWLFRTADFSRGAHPRTGDPTAPEGLASGGWLRQQVEGVRRMVRVLRGRDIAA